MSNELKKSTPWTVIGAGQLTNAVQTFDSETFYTGNYNTLKLHIVATPTGTPPALEFHIRDIDPITLEHHEQYVTAQKTITTADVSHNNEIGIELRCNTIGQTYLRLKCTGIIGTDNWIVEVRGQLIEETSAPTTAY